MGIQAGRLESELIYLSKDNKSGGFTLLEVLVGMTILIIGASALWYAYIAAIRIDFKTSIRNDALKLAKNDIEIVRVLPRSQVRDTIYEVEGMRGKKYSVKRTVLDSAKIFEIMDEIDINETGSPLYLRRPLEIRVNIYEIPAHDSHIDYSEEKPVFSLSFLKPQYQWH